MARGRRTTIVAILAGLALSGCGGEAASVQTEDEARQAIVDTVRDSWSAELRVDMDLTDAHVDAIADAMAAADGVTEDDVAFGREYLALLREQASGTSSVLARAEDGSWRLASLVDDDPLFDLRFDATEALAADTLTPEVTVLLQVDIPAFLDQLRESMAMMSDLDPAMPDPSMMFPTVDVIRQQVEAFLPPGGVRDMVLAVVDGAPGGATGVLDLAALGATQDDLDEFRTGWRDDMPAEPAELAAALDDAISIRDLAPADGLTTAVVDVHPRAAVEGLGELSESLGEVDDWRADFESETGMAVADLPETVPGVARIAYDADGRLRHLVVPVLDVAREVLAHVDDVPTEVEGVLADLSDARYDVVVTFSDVGQVDSVLDVDATTVTWAELVETFEAIDTMSGGATARLESEITVEVPPTGGTGEVPTLELDTTS